ncbi:hypothetical protein IAQ61_002111, partial [Plenodomus lingam]|uniref:Predicted protein n=1 Tax=Leptosphaeria maculans (strain JN3 / isolate v23.1.3 / race Av1-4-5-6-7-8) TaxID=985895 RepID=E4ZH49_LEPMJ
MDPHRQLVLLMCNNCVTVPSVDLPVWHIWPIYHLDNAPHRLQSIPLLRVAFFRLHIRKIWASISHSCLRLRWIISCKNSEPGQVRARRKSWPNQAADASALGIPHRYTKIRWNEQFGWPKETWLQSEPDLLLARVGGSHEFACKRDWEELQKTDDERRKDAVKSQGKAKFASVKEGSKDYIFEGSRHLDSARFEKMKKEKTLCNHTIPKTNAATSIHA